MKERNREYNELVKQKGKAPRAGQSRVVADEVEEEKDPGTYAATLPINDRASELVCIHWYQVIIEY